MPFSSVLSSISPIQVFLNPSATVRFNSPNHTVSPKWSVSLRLFLFCQTRQSDIDVSLLVRSSQPNERSENRLYISFQWQPKPPTCSTGRCIINPDEKTQGNLSFDPKWEMSSPSIGPQLWLKPFVFVFSVNIWGALVAPHKAACCRNGYFQAFMVCDCDWPWLISLLDCEKAW